MTRILLILALFGFTGCSSNADYVRIHHCTLIARYPAWSYVYEGREIHHPEHCDYSCPGISQPVDVR